MDIRCMIELEKFTKKEFDEFRFYIRRSRVFPDGSEILLVKETLTESALVQRYRVWYTKKNTAYRLVNEPSHFLTISFFDIELVYNELTEFKRNNVSLDIEDIVGLFNL